MGSWQAMDGGEHAREDRRRLAAERPVHRAVGPPLNITGNGTLLNTPGNTAFANLNGENKVLGGLGPGQPVLRPDGVLAAGGRRSRQHEAQQRPGGSGLLAARHVALQAVLAGRQPLRRVPHRRVQHDEFGSLGQPQRPPSAPLLATRSARSPPRTAASAASASADGLCSAEIWRTGSGKSTRRGSSDSAIGPRALRRNNHFCSSPIARSPISGLRRLSVIHTGEAGRSVMLERA